MRRQFRWPRLSVQTVFVVLADAGVGELKLVLHAADPAAQIYLYACGQKPDVARAGMESAVELLVRLRVAEDHTTHIVSLSRSLVRGPFSLLSAHWR